MPPTRRTFPLVLAVFAIGLALLQMTDVGAQTAIRLRAPYRVTVGTSAAALTSSGGVLGITLKALCPGQTIYIGSDNTVSTSTGWPMYDGDSLNVEVSDAANVWAVATAAGQQLAVLPYRRN